MRLPNAAFVLLAGCQTVFGLEPPHRTIDSQQSPKCPPDYDVMIPSSTSSYRIVATVNKFEAQRLNCQQDLVSGTHLMTPDLPAEAAGISAVLPAAQSFYVGVIQARDQAKTDIGWTLLTGEPVLEALWGTDQPIDGPSSHYFEDNEANVAELRTGTANGLLHDARGDLAQPAICECDGKATPQQ